MKTFYFLWSLAPTLRVKLLCTLTKIVYASKARNPGTGSTTGVMLTKPTKSAQPTKLTASIKPFLLSLPAMLTDLACLA